MISDRISYRLVIELVEVLFDGWGLIFDKIYAMA